MKKLLIFACLAICIFLGALTNGANLKTVNAETLTGAKLQYFELNNPLCVARDGEVVYIAEEQLLVIYCDDTYHKIDLAPYGDFKVKQIAKCGDFLLTLYGNTLFALNLSDYSFSPVSYPADSAISFDNIDCFAVNNNHFAILNNERNIFVFELNDGEELSFDLIFMPDQASDRSDCLALTDELNVFYHSKNQSAIFHIIKESGMQGSFKAFTLSEVDCFAYDNEFFFKSANVIYKLGSSLNSSTPEVVVDLTCLNIINSGDFFISNGKILICDTQNDRIVEYDINQGGLTQFEISFTKIDFPEDFEISFNDKPEYLAISAGVKLYDIDLLKSQTLGYFSFNGYHTQKNDGEYLVVAQIADYYVITGEVTALVLTQDFEPELIKQATVDKIAYLTTDAKAYLQPRLTKEFASFELKRFSAVEVLTTLTLSNVEYSLIKQGENVGYIPSSFLVSALNKLPEYNSFETANVANKTVNLYEDEACTILLTSIPANTQVLITNKGEKAYKVICGEHSGYLLKDDIQKRGTLTNKRVAVIILLAIAVFITTLHFEKKYVFNKKKHTLKQR